MPRYEDVIGQFQGRPTGSPVPPMVPGGSPSASQPGQASPPGMNTAMPGRKPDNLTPMGMPGMPLPPQTPQIPEMPGEPATEKSAGTMEDQKNTNQAVTTLMLNRIPTAADMLDLPPGIRLETPYGPVDAEGNISVSPEYEQKQKEAIVRARQKFGPHPWAGMAGVPEPSIQLGKSYFNPFTNGFGRAE